MVPVAWFFLPDSPEEMRSLTSEEKAVAKARGVRQAGSSERVGSVNFKEVLATFASAKPWFTAVCALCVLPRMHANYVQLMYFSVNVSFASLPVFLPTILRESECHQWLAYFQAALR